MAHRDEGYLFPTRLSFAVQSFFRYNGAVQGKLCGYALTRRPLDRCKEGTSLLAPHGDAPRSQDEQIAALMERGHAAAHDGQKARARRYFAAVLEIDPSYEEAWLERASVVDEPQEAMAHLAQALMLNPGNEQARQALRLLRQSAGNLSPYRGDLPVTTVPIVAADMPPFKGMPAYAWALLGVAILVFLAGGALWAGAPQTVLAALLPTDTPTITPTITPSPTATPAITPSPTFTVTPSPAVRPASFAARAWIRTSTATDVPTFTPTPTPLPKKVPADQSQSEKWIEVDISEQQLCAHEGQETLFCTSVSTGTNRYPTVKGRFKIYAKYSSTHMSGPGYSLPNVPWTMYFHRGYAIHGTYWHNNFGRPMSHGCVNVKTPVARRLFQWAPKGTLVVVHP
jgi:lipoprotein-anchoring transpeptidase ErfK/SrfK